MLASFLSKFVIGSKTFSLQNRNSPEKTILVLFWIVFFSPNPPYQTLKLHVMICQRKEEIH